MAHYDIAIVGSGLFGSIVAFEAMKRGKSVLVVEARDHIGGNCYTKQMEGINVHLYGAHIFRSADKKIWDYMSQLCTFNNFINSPIANYKGELYNMPFNMNTFYAMWKVRTPQEAKEMIAKQCVPCEHPANLEEHILSSAGRDIYQKLVKGYTEKQWGKPCSELPASIMRRIPLRFTFDNNYFRDPYQGIPIGGYTPIFEKLLKGAEIKLKTDYLKYRQEINQSADMIIYTGPIDAFYDYSYGELGYRSLRFEHEEFELANKQGVAVMNYTDAETPYTRTIEHKHFEFGEQPVTVVSKEYPQTWHKGIEPYYPMEDGDNQKRFMRYRERSLAEEKIRFGGRLGEYRYYDMQDTVKSALAKVNEWFCSA